MRKKILIILTLFVSLIFGSNTLKASIAETEQFELSTVEYVRFDDGSFLKIELTDISITNKNLSLLDKTTYTKIGKKDASLYKENGELLWTFTVIGYFEIDPGVSVESIYSDYSVDNRSSAWHFSNGESGYYSNLAYGKGTFKHKALFITIKTVDVDIAVSCDANGVLH